MFKKATKTELKLRLALSGASGSGKTYSALAIATHLGKKVAVIDTERGSASRYASVFDFDVCELNIHHPNKYVEAIRFAENEGYDVIVVDSLSHAWFVELDLVGGNFNNWRNVRPLERGLIDAIVASRSHMICTMRSKTEYAMDEGQNGKKTAPKKIGTAPIQTSGIEYEFDIAGELDFNHCLTISKSRCPALSDRQFLHPGKDIADELLRWLTDADEPWQESEIAKASRVRAAREAAGLSQQQVVDLLQSKFGADKPQQLTTQQVDELIELIKQESKTVVS